MKWKVYQMDMCFVILHYMDLESTIECIESIIRMFREITYKIIIVDNGSPNKSGEFLKQNYHLNTEIEVILIDKNLGFAKGNNIGYQYAKENYKPKYILVGNNDLKFVQKNFYELLNKCDDEKKFDVAGPDIINLKGLHQNPYRDRFLSLREWKKKYKNQKAIYCICLLRKHFVVLKNFDVLSQIYHANGRKKQNRIRYDREQSNIVLHGSCLIFANRYLQEQDEAFFNGTFMYHEEEFLYLRCFERGYHLYYLPQLCVEHKEGMSTKKRSENNLEKELFIFRENSRSLKLLIKEIKKINTKI